MDEGEHAVAGGCSCEVVFGGDVEDVAPCVGDDGLRLDVPRASCDMAVVMRPLGVRVRQNHRALARQEPVYRDTRICVRETACGLLYAVPT